MEALKNKLANSLMAQRQIVIDGMEINLWHGHSHETVITQLTWNKIKSYTELNSHSTGENGDLVFTGVMQIHRNEAAEYAIKLGFRVHAQVSPYTNFVVIGSENVSPSKIARVIQLNNYQKANIKIIEELTFLALVSEYIIK